MEFFILWVVVLILLFMFVVAPLPEWLRAVGLIVLVVTIWLLWAWYGVEILAEARWPQHEQATAVSTVGVAASSAAGEEGKTARLGQIGDLFGGVNALFSALAFSGVCIGVHQQWKSTRLAFKQATEATFFSAIELHHRIVNDLRLDSGVMPDDPDIAWLKKAVKKYDDSNDRPKREEEALDGRVVFFGVLSAVFKNSLDYKEVERRYEFLQNEHNYVLGHYFRSLYQILKLIDSDEALDSAGRQKYASLLRAQLSSYELVLLMINCSGAMVDDGRFRQLLVRYRMLEHAPIRKREDGVYVCEVLSGNIDLKKCVEQYFEEGSLVPRPQKIRGAFGLNKNI